MKIILSGINNLSITLSGSISKSEYTWFVKPLIDIINKFEDDFESLFEALFKLKEWARRKGINLIIRSTMLFKKTFFFFCKTKENEEIC